MGESGPSAKDMGLTEKDIQVGEPKGPPVEGVDDISSSIAAARENVATVEQLTQLLLSVGEVQKMHTTLKEVTRYLEDQMLKGKDDEERADANSKLQKLQELLTNLKNFPESPRLVLDLDRWLSGILPKGSE